MRFFPLHSLIILLNIAVEFGFFIISGRMFQRRAPLKTSELTPNLFALLFGNCNRFLFRNSYVKSSLSKNVHIDDGFSSERHLKIKVSISADTLCAPFVHLSF